MWQVISVLCAVGTVFFWGSSKLKKDGKEKQRMAYAGMLIVIFVVSLYFSNSSNADKETTSSPQNDANSFESVSTGGDQVGDFNFQNLSVKRINKLWSGAVEVTNTGSSSFKTVLFTVIFYSADGERIGIAKGNITNLASGESKTESFITSDDLSTGKTYKYQLDIAN